MGWVDQPQAVPIRGGFVCGFDRFWGCWFYRFRPKLSLGGFETLSPFYDLLLFHLKVLHIKLS